MKYYYGFMSIRRWITVSALNFRLSSCRVFMTILIETPVSFWGVGGGCTDISADKRLLTKELKKIKME